MIPKNNEVFSATASVDQLFLEENTEARLYLTIGLPRSGKTTIAKELAEHYDCPYINLGEFIQSIGGNMVPGLAEQVSFNLCNIIGFYLLSGKSVVLDAPMLTRDSRSSFLKAAKNLGFPVYGFWMMCKPETQVNRLKGRNIDPEALQHIKENFEPPLYTEGFTSLTTISTDPKDKSNSALIYTNAPLSIATV